MDSGAWWATVHGAARSWTRLSTRHTFDLIGRGETSWVHSFAHIAPLGGHEQRTDLQGTYTRCALYTDKGVAYTQMLMLHKEDPGRMLK